MSTPQRFKPGDRVIIAKGGRGHVWRVVRTETAAWESEPAYALNDGLRERYASESALKLAPAETAADREAWWERNCEQEEQRA